MPVSSRKVHFHVRLRVGKRIRLMPRLSQMRSYFNSGVEIMAHVVTEPCFGCKYTDCVLVCPVDAFREGDKMLYIDPDVCICCDMCIPECPVEAIFSEDDVP